MKEEILNINYYRRLYLVKAIRRYGTMDRAASALGVTTRTAFFWKKKFKITKSELQGKQVNQN